MSLWNYWVSRENFKSVTGRDDSDAYWRFEGFLWLVGGFIAAAVAAVGAAVYVAYSFWKEISLEVGYMKKYGADWQAEFERYHGSLSHAHLRLAVVFLCLMALLVILGWVARRFYRLHKHKKHNHAV
jgi:hypothetical protein